MGTNANRRKSSTNGNGHAHGPVPEASDALALLESDHRKMESLLAAYAEVGPRDLERKWQIVAALRLLVAVHSTIEEEILYAAIRAAGNRGTSRDVAEAMQEHHVVDVLLEELSGCNPSREEFDAKVEVLDENLTHHIEEEETDLFVEAHRRLSRERLVELGAAMEVRRGELMGQPRTKDGGDLPAAGLDRWIRRVADGVE